MPLFCRVDWPRRLGLYFRRKKKALSVNADSINGKNVEETDSQAKESPRSNCFVLPSNEISRNEGIHEKGINNVPRNNNSIRTIKYLPALSEKATSEKKEENYFIESKSEMESDGEDNDEQSSKNSMVINEEKVASVCKKIRTTQKSPKVTRKQKLVTSILL